MLNDHEVNGCLQAPGLAIGGGSKLTFKYGNTFQVRDGKYISAAVTTADAPALTTAEDKDGDTPGDLAIDYLRIYTLLANVSSSDGTVTFTLAASEDFDEDHVITMDDINFGNAADNDSHKAVVGFIVIKNTTNAFVPGTTALDASGVTVRYFDNIVPLLG
jgi:hypothetical protein